MKRALVIAAIAGFCLGGSAPFIYRQLPSAAGDGELATPRRPLWTEAQWPFPMDEWGKGKAFRCEAANCGVEVNLYVRAKIGFCNCTTGVADDEELHRIADLRLIGERPSALNAGSAIRVAWMKGRSRAYIAERPRSSALVIAFNDRCDAVVATALVGHPRPTAIEPAVIAFLNSETVVHWAEVTLGL
jgi:hypothetical protein